MRPPFPNFRRRLAALCALAALGTPFGPASADGAPGALHVYTWAEYIDPGLVAEFEAAHDAVVRFDYFDSDEQRDLELAESGGGVYDVILMSDTRIGAAGRRGWLAPIDREAVPNARHVDPRWAEAVPGALEYGVPYLRGSMGIAWRTDLVATPPTRWLDLLEPSAELRGRVLMDGDARQLVAVALKADGASANTGSRAAIDRAAERLLAQRPHVRGYGYPGLGPESSLARGDVVAAMVYSGDVLTMQAHTPTLAYALPEEGGLLWVDYLTVGAGARDEALAHAFIDFLTRPANAARLADHLHFATPNRAAEALLPPDFLADPVIYPSAAELERAEFVVPLPPRRKRDVNTIGAQLALQ